MRLLDKPYEFKHNKDPLWGISSVGRAFEWHSKGQRFDSAMLHFMVLNLLQDFLASERPSQSIVTLGQVNVYIRWPEYQYILIIIA